MKLAAKLAKIMGTVERIPKTGRNRTQNYDYATEADVADHVRGLLAENNIILISDMEACERITRINKDGIELNDITRVRVRFTFYDGDSDETITFCVYGEGHDSLDKGPYKAFTGAEKYALMKSLLIPTGDDPEADERPKSQSKSRPQDRKEPPPTKQDGNAPKATAKQWGAIHAIAKALGWGEDYLKSFLADEFKCTSDNLTVPMASEVIKVMGKMQDEKEPIF